MLRYCTTLTLLSLLATTLLLGCSDLPPTPRPVPTPTLLPHPTLTPPLTWDIIDEELADPSSTWRKEHLFRVFANTLQSHDDELKKYDNRILTIEGPYSHRTDDYTMHLQWHYLEHSFTVNCRIWPRPDASQVAYLDSIEQDTPTMTVWGEFLYKPGQLPGFYYSEKNADDGFNVYLDLVYNRCEILTIDGRPWPPPPPITPSTAVSPTPIVVVVTAKPLSAPTSSRCPKGLGVSRYDIQSTLMGEISSKPRTEV